MKDAKQKGPALSRSSRPRRDRRAPMARWFWTALSLLLAANWYTDVLMARRLSAPTLLTATSPKRTDRTGAQDLIVPGTPLGSTTWAG